MDDPCLHPHPGAIRSKKTAECGDAADFRYILSQRPRALFFKYMYGVTDRRLSHSLLPTAVDETASQQGLIADLASNCPRPNYISGCLLSESGAERERAQFEKETDGQICARTHTHILLPPRRSTHSF